jgi:hypothetical protein
MAAHKQFARPDTPPACGAEFALVAGQTAGGH